MYKIILIIFVLYILILNQVFVFIQFALLLVRVSLLHSRNPG